jgi:hypothetical protein
VVDALRGTAASSSVLVRELAATAELRVVLATLATTCGWGYTSCGWKES